MLSSRLVSIACFTILATALQACTTTKEARVVQDTPGAPAVASRPSPSTRPASAPAQRPAPQPVFNATPGASLPSPAAPAGQSAGDVQRRSQVRLELAAALYQQGNYAQALEEARTAIAIEPRYAQAYGLLGLIYMDLGDRERAEEEFRRALSIAPADSELHNNYGWFLCQTGRLPESIAEFMAALQDPLYATPARPLHNAGVCSLRMGDVAAAETYFTRAFQIDARNPVSMYHLAEINLKRGNLDQAKFYSQRLLSSWPPSAETLWLALRVDRRAGDRVGYESLSSQLVKQFPESAEAGKLKRGEFGD